MKSYKNLYLLLLLLVSSMHTIAQMLPPDPGSGGGGGGTAVPLDGGIIMTLIAAGSIGISLFVKSKKKDK